MTAMPGSFDAAALHAALDARRQSSEMTWRQVAETIGVSASTLRRTAQGGSMETDGMLAMVRWLGRAPEDFTNSPSSGSTIAEGSWEASGQMLRFDPSALHAALDAERMRREMTWNQVADEVGASASTLTGLAKGGRVSVDVMLAVVGWLGRPSRDFTHFTQW